VSVNDRQNQGKIMISRVFVRNGTIYLDSDMFGKRARFSTGKKEDKRLLKWYKKNFEDEYEALYYSKNKKPSNINDLSFREYGSMIIEMTNVNRTEETIKEVQSKFKKLCEFFGDMPIKDIKASNILMWQSSCGYASKTISNYRCYLNIILEYAFNDEIINRNPMKAVKAPKIKPVRDKIFYYREDIKKILDAATDKMKDILFVFLFTGVRGGELIALRWDNVDFENEILHITNAIRDGREKLTKSEKERHIPMFKPVFNALKRQQKRTGLGKYIFMTKDSTRYRNQDAIRKSFKHICEVANVEVGSLHDLRRSFNTLLKQDGVQNDAIIDIIGHTNDDVNRKHYTGKIDINMSIYDKFAV